MSNFAFGYSFTEVVIIAVCVVAAVKFLCKYLLIPIKGE
ncbi:hypothetical protein CHUUTOTORO_00660 [Serratia phage vB_SmaM-ChuuTotoro]|nr:hypothetical protein CHUUTOTORO_00660 [Serratia phage vB_SmaM-ChuuTotoro]